MAVGSRIRRSVAVLGVVALLGERAAVRRRVPARDAVAPLVARKLWAATAAGRPPEIRRWTPSIRCWALAAGRALTGFRGWTATAGGALPVFHGRATAAGRALSGVRGRAANVGRTLPRFRGWAAAARRALSGFCGWTAGFCRKAATIGGAITEIPGRTAVHG